MIFLIFYRAYLFKIIVEGMNEYKSFNLKISYNMPYKTAKHTAVLLICMMSNLMMRNHISSFNQ